jgi:hypothetical protein
MGREDKKLRDEDEQRFNGSNAGEVERERLKAEERRWRR